MKEREKTAVVLKNIISGILLMGVLTDPLVGTFTWLYVRKSLVRKEVKKHLVAGFEKDHLVLLKFTKEESRTRLRWEHSREFEYNHQMYDVVKSETRGDTVYYWCWWDREETKLKRRMARLAARTLGNSPKIGEKSPLPTPSFKTLYCATSRSANLSRPEPFHERRDVLSDIYSSIFLQPPKPPPRPA
jgi:hypothetical protein